MARKPSNGGWIGLGVLTILGVAVAAALNNSPTDPDYEGIVDRVVGALNQKLGNGWGTLAVDAIKAAIHPDMWSIAAVVVDVEQMAVRVAYRDGIKPSGPQKRARAVARLRSRK